MKNFILISALIVSIVIGFILFREWRSEQNEHKLTKDQYQEALLINADVPLPIIDTIRDTMAGTVSYIYKPLQTTGPVTGYVSKGVADTLAMALGVATKEIDRLKSMVITIKAEGKGERITDTVRKVEWLVLKNDPTFDVRVNLTNDSIYPGVRLGLDQAYAPYRKNIFHRTEYRSVIRARDPRVQISEIRDVTKVPKSSRWGLGFSVGPVITPEKLSYGIMLGATYDIIQP